jgi:hypothetical protein
MKGTAGGVCMLLAQPGAVGLAAQLSVSIAEGARGHGVRRVEVAGASEQLRQSATGAIGYVYDVLAREKYLNRRLLVRISPGADLAAATGDSGGLAFALAFALAAAPRGQISVAATGILGDDGSIQPVNGVPQKLAAALAVLPPGGILVFPGGNERDVAPRAGDGTADHAAARLSAGGSSGAPWLCHHPYLAGFSLPRAGSVRVPPCLDLFRPRC